MPTVGDIVHYRAHNPATGDDTTSPAIITQDFADLSEPWPKGRQIKELTVFGHSGATYSIQVPSGETDDDGNWVPGTGWAESNDGSDLSADASELQSAAPPQSAALPQPPTSATVTTQSPATEPAVPSGAVMNDHPDGLDGSDDVPDPNPPGVTVTDAADERARLDEEIAALYEQRRALG